MVVLGQIGCIRAKWLCSGNVVEFGQKWFLWGKSGCIPNKSGCVRANWLYSVKSFVYGKKCLCLDKVVVFGQK